MGDIPIRHHQTKNDPRQNVRIGGLERTLHNFNVEMGQKVATVLSRYHRDNVVPLLARVEWLEKPLWLRFYLRSRQLGSTVLPWLRSKLAKKAPAPMEPPAPPVASVPASEAKPE